MSTLREAQKLCRRHHTFMGKPRKVVSGKPLIKIRPSSQRSEVLMDDQIEAVQDLQDQLQHAMVCLMQAKSAQETLHWNRQVDHLKTKSEELVLLLKVVGKLNSELVYAKIKLKETLRGTGGDVASARKRVVWLEERMNNLLEKYNRSSDRKDEILADKPIAVVSPREKPPSRQSSASYDERDIMRRHGTDKMAGGDACNKLPVLPSGGIMSLAQQETETEQEEKMTFMTEDQDDSPSAEKGHSPVQLDYSYTGDFTSKDRDRDLNESSDTIYKSGDRNQDGLYWQSPHHRFDFSEQFDAITRENPLSYHNLGLAVPSSFMEPAPDDVTELPWRQTENGDFVDSNNLAMEKISERIHEIQSKMADAAVKSAEHGSTPAGGRQSRLIRHQSQYCGNASAVKDDTKVQDGREHKRPSGSPASNGSEPLPSTNGTNLPPVGSRVSNRNARNLKYYPKPVPSPVVLPVTRTNRDKKYPRISSDWNDTPTEEMVPTKPLVNQMNLATETNLLSYRKNNRHRGASPAIKTNEQSAPDLTKMTPTQSYEGGNQYAVELARLIGARCHSGVKHLEMDGPERERVMAMLSTLESERVEERRDTARNFGALDCCEPCIITALTKRLEVDSDSRVRYESAKSLISLGFWSSLPLSVMVKYLKNGSHTAKLDVVRTMIYSRNAHTVDKTLAGIKQLISILRDLCANPSTEEDLAYNSAVCLGRLCVPDEGAKQRLLVSLGSSDTHAIAWSLEILVRLFNASNPTVIDAIFDQLQNSTVWRYRAAAARLLGVLGPECYQEEGLMSRIYGILRRQLYDDPSQGVRADVATTLTALGMRDWIVEQVQRELFAADDDCRAHAVISVGVLSLKRDKTIRTLLDMLDLDSSEYVRIQVIRTLAALEVTQGKVIRALKERGRAGGSLAREAAKALRVLSTIAASRNTARYSPRR